MLRKLIVPAIVALALAFASCASGPVPAPDWVLSAPPADATNTYFVGSASDAAGDVSKATNDAAANLVASIMQYIGVKVTVDSSATAKATLDSYQADIQSTVTTRSDNRLSGFQVKGNYVQSSKKESRVTVYVLAAYATADLEKEKRRIAALFQEQIDAVAKPEAEGRAFAESGRAYDAFRKFVEAAVAASGADIDNAGVKLERNLNAARSALAKVRFDKSGAEGMTALIGQSFAKPFAVRLVQGEGSSAPGVPGAVILVSYQRKSGTRLVSKTESELTGPDGLLSFS
ncbi:MAG: hypothetical protein Q8M76_03155, partial [Spirochaetaceae bacterium]|nr:hypothetical protein [Spirochaetaceae bacterium]